MTKHKARSRIFRILLGHLQLVHDDGSYQEEIEVQSGDVFSGIKWSYPGRRDHTDTVINTTPYGNPQRHKASDALDIGERDPDEVWQILTTIDREFFDKGKNIDYTPTQNSNSYINTLLYMIGITLDDALLADATPPEVGNIVFGDFPGSGNNVILSDFTKIDFDLDLTSGDDYLRTGIGDDSVDGMGETIR